MTHAPHITSFLSEDLDRTLVGSRFQGDTLALFYTDEDDTEWWIPMDRVLDIAGEGCRVNLADFRMV